jgi:4-amino-4-deoxy-L-arabinose transferase-like glycosyltransferase
MAVFDDLIVPHSPPQQVWRSPWWLFLAALLATLASTGLAAFSREFNLRWVMWWLWFVPMVTMLSLTIIPSPRGARQSSTVVSSAAPDGVGVWPIFLLVVACGFFLPFISSYPFPAVGDEIRDGALRAQEIALGTRLNIFGFDWSQGLLCATLNSFAYDLFGPSVLVYRIPGIITSFLTVLLIFLGFGRLFGYRFSVFVAAIVATNSAVLFFARTQPLISFSILLTTAALIVAVRMLEADPDVRESLLLPGGCLLGLAITAHASARPLVGILVVGSWLFASLRSVRSGHFAVQRVVSGLCILIAAALVGCGPFWMEIRAEELFGVNRLEGGPKASLLSRLFSSIAVFFEGDLSMAYAGRSLLSPWFAFLVAAATVFCLLRGSRFSKLCCVMVLATLLTNSALTDLMMGGHRVVMVVLFVACIVAECFTRLTQDLPRRRKVLLEVLFVAVLCWEGSRFFTQQRAILEVVRDQAALPVVSLRHMVNHIRSSARWQGVQRIALVAREASPLFEFLQPLHITEFFQFFLPGQEVVLVADNNLEEGILMVAPVQDGSPFPRALRRIEMPKTPFGTTSAPPVYEVFWDPPMAVPGADSAAGVAEPLLPVAALPAT